MSPLRRLVLIAAAALAVAGCGVDYDHTDIDNVKTSLPGGSLNVARVQVPAGALLTAHIVSYGDDKKPMAMGLRSKDTTVVDVSNVVSEHDYAFFGLRAGTTEVEMTANGKVVLILTAVVPIKPPLP